MALSPWRKLYGLWRLACIVGLWNFIKNFIMSLIYRQRIQFFNFKGMPIPIVGFDVYSYRKLLENDVASFETRPDDVFVVAFGKSGHHWSYDFINMLLNGNLVLDNIVKEAFFMEFIIPASHGMGPFDRLESPRMIFTHFHADALPRQVMEKKRKIVRLIRNPKDVAVSAYHHRRAMSPHMMDNMEWNDFIDELMDVVEGKRDSDEPFFANKTDWFTYELDCETKLNNLDHSIVLHYEDLKENMLPELRKLARFLGKDYDDEFLKKIVERTELDYVKKNKDLGMHDVLMRKGTLYRKGVIGDWKNHFSAEQNRRFDSIIAAKMKGCPIMENIRYEPSNVY